MFCYVYWEFLCVSFGCLLVFGVTQKTFEAVLTAMGLLLLNLLGRGREVFLLASGGASIFWCS